MTYYGFGGSDLCQIAPHLQLCDREELLGRSTLRKGLDDVDSGQIAIGRDQIGDAAEPLGILGDHDLEDALQCWPERLELAHPESDALSEMFARSR